MTTREFTRPPLLALPLIGALTAPVHAQCPPGLVATSGIGNNSPRAVTTLPDGSIVASGSFTLAGGNTVQRIARYSYTTNTWSLMGPGATSTSSIDALKTLANGDVLAGGNYSMIGGTTAQKIARWSAATDTWSPLGPGLTGGGVVYAIAVLPDGDFVVGGNITQVAGINLQHIARYRPSTNTWSNMNSLMASSGDQVHALAVHPDGTLIVAGTFLNGGGSTVGARRIARYNPTTGAWSSVGPSFSAGGGLNSTVEALGILPDGDIVAAGYFDTAAGVPANLIARYDAVTGWANMGNITGSFGYIKCLTVLPDGDVVVGGSFTVAGGIGAARLARCDYATGTWSALGAGANVDVNGLTTLPVGDIVAAGLFTSPATRILRYTWGGTAPTIDVQPVPAAACPGGIAAFTVTPAGTAPFACQWQWKQGAGPWTPTVDGLNSDGGGQPLFDAVGALTSSLAIDPPAADTVYPVITVDVPLNHRCIVTNACSSVTSGAAQLMVDPADIGKQGGLSGHDGHHDNNDFVVFIEHFFNHVPDADVGRQGGLLGSDGLFDNNDFVIFIDRFFVVC